MISSPTGLAFPIVPDVIEAIRADEVRALALASTQLSGVLPDVPLMPQLDYPDLVASALDRALRPCADARNGDRPAAYTDAGIDGER